VVGPVDGCEPRSGRRVDGRSGEVGILHGVDVDRCAVSVSGQDVAAGDGAAVVARGVVRRHRPFVVASVVIDQAHPLDRPSCVVEPVEDVDDGGVLLVHDRLTGVRGSVEAQVGHLQVPQAGHGDRAAGVVAVPHPVAQAGADRPDSCGVRRRRRVMSGGAGHLRKGRGPGREARAARASRQRRRVPGRTCPQAPG